MSRGWRGAGALQDEANEIVCWTTPQTTNAQPCFRKCSMFPMRSTRTVSQEQFCMWLSPSGRNRGIVIAGDACQRGRRVGWWWWRLSFCVSQCVRAWVRLRVGPGPVVYSGCQAIRDQLGSKGNHRNRRPAVDSCGASPIPCFPCLQARCRPVFWQRMALNTFRKLMFQPGLAGADARRVVPALSIDRLTSSGGFISIASSSHPGT